MKLLMSLSHMFSFANKHLYLQEKQLHRNDAAILCHNAFIVA